MGRVVDPETGLIYLRARYYDPATAQFLTRDPLDAVTHSAYGYIYDNPLNGADPTGLGCGVFDPGACVSDAVHAVGNAAAATGSFVYNNAGTLSTITSALATVAYIGCAVSAGLGCGLGLALSVTSTALSGLNAYRACSGGGGSCRTAAIGLGISAVATVTGGIAQYAAAGAVSDLANSYAQDTYLARQAGVIGAVGNGISTLYGLLTSAAAAFADTAQCSPVPSR